MFACCRCSPRASPCAALLTVPAPASPPLAPSAELAAKLALMEGKLLHGEQRGGLDRLAAQTAAQLRGQQAELARQRAAEAQAAAAIAALEAAAAEKAQSAAGLAGELAELDAALAAASAELQAAAAELQDVRETWERDREELVEQIRCAGRPWVAGAAGGIDRLVGTRRGCCPWPPDPALPLPHRHPPKRAALQPGAQGAGAGRLCAAGGGG